jgi:putative transposase
MTDQEIKWRGKPKVIRSNNGPEYIGSTLMSRAQNHGIRLEHIQLGKPLKMPTLSAITAR